VGGPIAALRDGDEITIDARHGLLQAELSEKELKSRLSRWSPPKPRYTSGVLAKYVKTVGSASRGAITE